jgi:sulfoxide reductase heme-binding subunit YedZ
MPHTPWQDRRGRFSPLKALALTLLALPGTVLLAASTLGGLGAEPVERLQDEAGLWALRFLFLSLAVTPLRLLWRWNELVKLRRMIGLAALFYALAHLWAYMALQDWVATKIASEIMLRAYLLVGFTALAVLVLLGTTSTDAAVRRLGAARWQVLHRLAYPAALLATVHMFWQTRLDPTQALVMSGLLAWLMAVRLWRWQTSGVGPAAALGLALAVTGFTAVGEALLFHLRFGVDITAILATNLGAQAGIRPAWWVGALSGAAALGALVRRRGPARRVRTA